MRKIFIFIGLFGAMFSFADEVRVVKKSSDLAFQYEWKHDDKPGTVVVNRAISVTNEKPDDNCKYDANNQGLRFYQQCGYFTLEAGEGMMIKSVKLTYASFNNSYGVLTKNFGEDGYSIPESDQIKSDVTYKVNAPSYRIWIGSTSATERGSIRVTKWEVVYEDSTSVLETLSNCAIMKASTVDVVGDKSLYKWKLTNVQHDQSDTIQGYIGFRVRNNNTGSSIAMNGVQEGGVKNVAFDWHITGNNNPVHFFVKVGSKVYEYQHEALGSSKIFMSHDIACNDSSNTSLSIYQEKEETPQQTYVVVAPITITPYLLFNLNNRRDTISVLESGKYDLKKVLINNTDDEPVFAVTSNTTGAQTSIVDGVLSVDGMTQKGSIGIKASWNNNKVTTTMTLVVERAPEVSFDQDTIKVDLYDKPFQNKLNVPTGVGAVTYSSSNAAVATVNSDGTVTPTGAGETVITAHVAAGTEYGAGEASYVVVVSYVPTGGEGWTETFSQCTTTKLYDGRVYVDGDDGVYDWSVARFQRLEEDTISGAQGIRLRYQGSIASAGEQEGGVKDVRFDWHATGVDNPVHFFVNVGEKEYEYKSDPIPTTTVMHFDRGFGLKENVALSISVPAQEKTVQSYIVVGPVTIVPYLLFTASNHKDTIRLVDATSYDLRDVLIDNTDSVGEIAYSILSDGTEAATMEGSVVDVSQAKKNGAVAVEAAWGDVTTTMTLWVEAVPETGLEEVQNAEGRMHNYKIIKDGQLRIWRGGEWYDVIGNTIK